jgi:2-keto-4-pentenoate hydratase
MGERESIGGEIAVGHLTSETVLPDGAAYTADGEGYLHADAEAMVEFATDVAASGGRDSVREAIGTYGAALEIVDLAPVRGGAASVVAANVFHRAVAFGDLGAPPSGDVRVLVDDELRGAAAWPDDLTDRLAAAARLLGAVGERFRAGDRVITGSIVQVGIGSSGAVVADFGGLTAVRLRVETR